VKYYADLKNNPHATNLSTKRLYGYITLPTTDAEGNQFRPEDMEFDVLLSSGYLDIDHLMFRTGAKDTIIGVPEWIEVTPQGVYATFILKDTKVAMDVYTYLKEKPKSLGFSIAGALSKPMFSRSGHWRVECVGISRFAINPASAAKALATPGVARLLTAMRALALDLNNNKPPTDYYTYFLSKIDDPLEAATLALWAKRLSGPKTMQAQVPRTNWDDVYEGLFIPPEETQETVASILSHWSEWLQTHPQDPHFTQTGRLKSWNDAVEHLRYCEGLGKEQIATILGYLREDFASLLKEPPPPASWGPQNTSATQQGVIATQP
jgi:hypothetical protein